MNIAETFKPVKILYFINGPLPTENQLVEAMSMTGASVCFRNATAVNPADKNLEKCDGVTGEVPESYAKEFPEAEVAIAKHLAAIEKLRSIVGDKNPPKANEDGEDSKTGNEDDNAKQAADQKKAVAAKADAAKKTAEVKKQADAGKPVWNGSK